MAATRDQLLEIAERALAEVRAEEAQATAWWERQLTAAAGRSVVSEALSVEVAVIRDGRVGTAVTTEIDGDGLARAAAAAARLAAGGPPAVAGLPDPGPGHEHDGYRPGRRGSWSPPTGWASGTAGGRPRRRRRSPRRAGSGRTSSAASASCACVGRPSRAGRSSSP